MEPERKNHAPSKIPVQDPQLNVSTPFCNRTVSCPARNVHNAQSDGRHSVGGKFRRRRLRRLPPPLLQHLVETGHSNPHPAAFSNAQYSYEGSPYRPGLNFFEYIPLRAKIHVASTLVFLGTEAAARVRCTVLRVRLVDQELPFLHFDNEVSSTT